MLVQGVEGREGREGLLERTVDLRQEGCLFHRYGFRADADPSCPALSWDANNSVWMMVNGIGAGVPMS